MTGAHSESHRAAKSPACSTAGGSREGITVEAIRPRLASNAKERCIPLRATRPLTARGGGQTPWDSRGAHIGLNHEAKSPACFTAGGSRGGGRSGRDLTEAGVECNRATYPTPRHAAIDRRGGVINCIWIQGGRTSNSTAKKSTPPAPRRVEVEGGRAVDAV